MSYQIQIKRSAQKELEELPKREQRRIVRAIESLSEDPRPQGVRKIVGGEDLYRLRVGDYRVVYQIQEAIVTIWVIRIGHRRDIYRHLP
jgi:mRNA interferase RelE/StbE